MIWLYNYTIVFILLTFFKGLGWKFVGWFSLDSSIKRIFYIDNNNNNDKSNNNNRKVKCIYGIRALSMSWIILGRLLKDSEPNVCTYLYCHIKQIPLKLFNV